MSSPGTGGIVVMIVDETGQRMRNVAVLVTSVTGVSMANLTDTEGVCSFSSLYPGNYTVQTFMEGYNGVVVNNVMIGVGKTVPVPIKLEPVNPS